MVKEIRFYKFKRLVVWTKGKFGTGEGLLGYGICARCKKKAPWGTRRIFRGTRCAKQAPVYGRDIRYRKRPPMVRGASSERMTKKRDAEKLHPHNQFTQAIKPQLFDFDTTRSRNFLLLNTLRQRNVKHTVYHLSLNGVKVDVFRKSKTLMV